MRRKALPYILVLPSVVVLLFLTAYPMAFSIYYSFQKWDLTITGESLGFIGVDNYLRAISDSRFINSLVVTFKFSAIALSTQLLLGLALALILNQPLKGQTVLRALSILPITVAPAVAAVLFRYMYYQEYGVLPYLLSLLGIRTPPVGILGSTSTAFWGVVAVDIWQWTPFVALLLLAALQAIPVEIIEAAKVDGASSINIFRYVTLPSIKYTLIIAALLRFMQAFNTFDIVYVLTRGGPSISTETMSHYIYAAGLDYLQIGYAGSLTWIVSIIALVIINIYLYVAFRGVEI